ncbi:MAG: hypothetical protein WC819_00705 [Parcubacteria group bacterium]
MRWIVCGRYEYEYDAHGKCTGWCRYVDGKREDGRHPAWHIRTGDTRIT